MGSAEDDNYVLKWNDFHAHFASSFQEMRNDGDFLDATVAIDETQQLQAHKVVLSASSPYFKSMLKNNPAQHPVLVMPPDVKYVDLVYVMEFIYNGEVRVNTVDLTSFMKLVALLKVKGLTQDTPELNVPAPHEMREEKKEPKKMKKVRKPSFSGESGASNYYYEEQASGSYVDEPQPPAQGPGIQLKGLVCPMCKQMYQDVTSLKEHMYANHGVPKDESTRQKTKKSTAAGYGGHGELRILRKTAKKEILTCT